MFVQLKSVHFITGTSLSRSKLITK